MRNIVFAAAVAAMGSVASAPSVMAQVANDDQTLAIAAILDNNSFDRAQLMIANQMQFWQPVLDTLLVMQPDGKVVPNLATAWSYNDDHSVLTLTLREGVSFTDGTPFDGNAVKANLDYLKKGAGQNGFMAALISQVEVVSPTEVRLYLSEPDPSLIDNLTVVAGAMASPATLGSKDFANNPIGSGPYIYDVSASVPGRQYVYNRNPNYWNKGAFPFERVTITPINDQVARLNALKSGQVDAGLGEARTVADAEANGLVVQRNDVNWLGFIIADREGKITPALADVRVRKALNMAFDKASILKFVELGFGRLSDQIFPTGSSAYVPELDKVYPFDPKAARALLEEAGYRKGFTLVLPELASFASFNPIVEKQLKDIGITVQWEKIAPNATIPELRSGRFPAYVFQFGYQGTWAEYQKFGYPHSAWNTSKVADPQLLKMLDATQHAIGDEQIKGYRDLNRYMVENAFFAPWYRRDTIYLTNKQTVVKLHPTNAVPHIRDFSKAE
ncbi:peptide/nickel transport system substrate-binding protein [Rhizobium petrolearium]|uniref:ABC transporter substrate-binding protein n=1 Tax=Neorhizobium petrolearium TaxID=515361 RepID=UPI001AE15FCF|nr:ABC transporter substrate-binding protein [Neorhizobium petrolearium]MBP1844258.1 peptide/nickel transport system substrate-binding protein [Neorhizobium petrolearium]